MGYLEDAPSSVKGIVCLMRDFGQYRYDPAEVFVDFIDFGIGCFLYEGDKELADRLKKKYGKDYDLLGKMLHAWVLIMNERITEEVRWFDALGTVYEYLASRSKKSCLGQFFTPPDLCDLMTQLTLSPEMEEKETVNDCACGSGRTLLSFNALLPGKMLYGEDLDPICTKMTALNMAIHGCQGQATCMDSISQEWRFCYEVNPYHRLGFPAIPHLLPVQEANCRAKLVPKPIPEAKEIPQPKTPKMTVKVDSGQLSLF